MRVKLFNFLPLVLSVWVLTSCTSQGSGILGKQVATSVDEDPNITNAPFAYEIAADTISYNSCVMQPSSTSPVIHGIKIGANEGFTDTSGTGSIKAGVKLRPKFLEYVGKNFIPAYPSNSITSEQIVGILNSSYSQNSGALVQIAVRRASDYAIIPDIITPAFNSTASAPHDATVLTQPLGSGFAAYSLTKGIEFNSDGIAIREGQRVYNLSDSSTPIPVEGVVSFNTTTDSSYTGPNGLTNEPFGVAEDYARRVRDNFNNNTQLLTLTFGGSGATTGNAADDSTADTLNNLKRPFKTGTSSFDATKAYGRGYRLKFESKTTVTPWPKSLLNGVTEVDLETGAPINTNSWGCEQIVIADQRHWNNNRPKNTAWFLDTTYVEPNCSPLLADDTNCVGGDTPTECTRKTDRAKSIKRLRRHYSADNWNIGLMFPAKLKAGYTPPNRKTLELCISPKASATSVSCYLPTTGILQADTTNPVTNELYDVGIQYDRTQGCYLTSMTIAGDRDPFRKKGRCAEFASICVRTNGNF